MLPWNGIPHFVVSRYTDGKYTGFLYLARSVVHFNENSEANARAAMLVYLIENKLIPLPAQQNSVWRKRLGRLKM